MTINSSTNRTAVFLDRDGVINVDSGYVGSVAEWVWCEGAINAIRRLNALGHLVLVITNQSGVARGMYTMNDVRSLHSWVNEELAKHGARIDEFYVAPWHPDYHCDLPPELLAERKPGSALFSRAASEWKIELQASWMVGDKVTDLIPAVKLGLRAALVRSRYTTPADRAWVSAQNIPIHESLQAAVRSLMEMR